MIIDYKVTPKFERNLKALKKKHFNVEILKLAINAIFKNDLDKLKRLKNHKLKGSMKDYYELHLASNVLLLYQLVNEIESNGTVLTNLILILVDVGNHDTVLNRFEK